ncbi:MAG TPA: septum formation initiator family protein [Actinopolymorphaceae bacterium]|jgi:hypothetical protein
MSLAERFSEIPTQPTRTRTLPETPQRRLYPVPDRVVQAGPVPFVLLVVGILGIGLVGLLLLNTSLQRGSFEIHDLVTQNAELEDRETALRQQVARLKAPESLDRRARALGMVPNQNPVFLRLSDGAVLGSAEPAQPAAPPPQPRQVEQPARTPDRQPDSKRGRPRAENGESRAESTDTDHSDAARTVTNGTGARHTGGGDP